MSTQFAVAERMCVIQRLPSNTMPIIHLVFAIEAAEDVADRYPDHGVSHAQHRRDRADKPTSTSSPSASTGRFYPFNAFRSLLGIAGDTSAPTYAELYSGEWRHPTCSGHGR